MLQVLNYFKIIFFPNGNVTFRPTLFTRFLLFSHLNLRHVHRPATPRTPRHHSPHRPSEPGRINHLVRCWRSRSPDTSEEEQPFCFCFCFFTETLYYYSRNIGLEVIIIQTSKKRLLFQLLLDDSACQMCPTGNSGQSAEGSGCCRTEGNDDRGNSF